MWIKPEVLRSRKASTVNAQAGVSLLAAGLLFALGWLWHSTAYGGYALFVAAVALGACLVTGNQHLKGPSPEHLQRQFTPTAAGLLIYARTLAWVALAIMMFLAVSGD